MRRYRAATSIGRSNWRPVTTRHKGGGHKRTTVSSTSVATKDAIPAKVRRIGTTNNTRTPGAGLLCRRRAPYVIARAYRWVAPSSSGAEADRMGNTLPILYSGGSTIHYRNRRCRRAAGALGGCVGHASAGRRAPMHQVRMRSGEHKIHIECRATIGSVANREHSLRRLGKTGVKAGWAFIRPFAVWW